MNSDILEMRQFSAPGMLRQNITVRADVAQSANDAQSEVDDEKIDTFYEEVEIMLQQTIYHTVGIIVSASVKCIIIESGCNDTHSGCNDEEQGFGETRYGIINTMQ